MSVEAPTPPFEIVPRPDGKLHDLPVAVRWEATRRHPYYLTLWEDARRYHQGKSDDPPELRLHAYAATLVLAAIGVTGEPVDPATPFSEVSGPDCDPTFLAGSVQPMTFRSVAMMLLGTLRAADLAAVGALFVRAGSEEYHAGHGPDVDNRRTAALNELIRMPSSALDSVPDAPLFYVHLGASQRSIAEDMRDQVRHRKERRGIGTSKVHGPKLGQYIEVWDLREGWTGDGYDAPRELSFGRDRSPALE